MPPSPATSGYNPLSIDMFYRVLSTTLLHPFVTCIIPLCLRARTVKWDAPPMIAAFAWAAFINGLYLLDMISKRIAYGPPREVDLSEEVIVITGGARGVGGLVAEVYGMRGASVAVLDVCEMEDAEGKGINFYKCDIGKKEEVLEVAKKVERDVSFLHEPSPPPPILPLVNIPSLRDARKLGYQSGCSTFSAKWFDFDVDDEISARF